MPPIGMANLAFLDFSTDLWDQDLNFVETPHFTISKTSEVNKSCDFVRRH